MTCNVAVILVFTLKLETLFVPRNEGPGSTGGEVSPAWLLQPELMQNGDASVVWRQRAQIR